MQSMVEGKWKRDAPRLTALGTQISFRASSTADGRRVCK
jgi:hypothetical protein